MPFIAFVGVAVTGATVVAFGEPVWNPVDLLARLAGQSGSPLLGIVAMVACWWRRSPPTSRPTSWRRPTASRTWRRPGSRFRTGGLIAGALGVVILPWALLDRYQTLADQLLRAARRGGRRAAGRLRGDSPRACWTWRTSTPRTAATATGNGVNPRALVATVGGHHRGAGRPGRPGLAAPVRRGLVLGRDLPRPSCILR